VKIEIWSDIACPWCYIGLNRFQRALDGFEHRDQVTVRLRSFQLDPSLPESYPGSEAEYLASSKGLSVERASAMTAQVAAVGASDGLRFDFDELAVANSRRAHRLLHLAEDRDPSGASAWALKQALFTAHFAQGRSIWDQEVLTELAASVGLTDLGDLDSDGLDAEVEADIVQAGRLGIRAVPTFVFADKYGVSGAQPVEAFAEAIEQVWNELNPAPLITLPGASDNPSCGIDGC
jgi:Predicted dithiol-disulfide isomerase involved in polyketide biosynthesis